jgi:nucleotide-binding universal stress UspA family protein
MYQRILIATDGSELSEKAVSSGIALAAALDADIVAYNAVPRYPSMYFEGAVVLTAAEVGRIEKQWHQKAQELVTAIQEEAHRHSVKAKAVTATASGSVSESIIAAAKKHKCDLIVMASHGRKGMSRLLLGSETLDVLTHSHVPVLVLR